MSGNPVLYFLSNIKEGFQSFRGMFSKLEKSEIYMVPNNHYKE
jgi:hypothetical protein